MVDFNNETTIGKPPKEIVSLILIEKIYNFLEADEDYSKKTLQGAGVNLAISRARLRSLFLMGHQLLKRALSKDEFNAVSVVCIDIKTKIEIEDIITAFSIIMRVLDSMGLIKIDTKPVYNRNSIEQSNRAQGFG